MTGSLNWQRDHGLGRSERKVRGLTPNDLGLVVPTADDAEEADVALEDALPLEIKVNDEYLQTVLTLKMDGYAGVILTGPPGTGKSWYAEQIAAYMTNRDPERVRFIQFHPSYQYEDFMEGFVPNEHGNGFELVPKHFVEMCDKAAAFEGEVCVLVIDELSRVDPSRVFGEALTYIEVSRRNQSFRLASQRELSIPDNLFIIATMNPFDRGVDEVDAAFERRFAKIAMEPDRQKLDEILTRNGLDEPMKERVLEFFDYLQRIENQYAKLGHAYFITVKDRASLQRLWKHQMRFQLMKAFHMDQPSMQAVEEQWDQVMVADGEQNERDTRG